MKVLTTIDLLALPSLETPPTGHVGFGAKSDGLYQKVGTVETKLSIDGHTHTIAQITGLQGALDLKATPADITAAINSIQIGGRNYFMDISRNSYQGNSIISVDGFYIANVGSYGGIIFDKAYIEEGVEYVLSFEYKTTDNSGWYTLANPGSAIAGLVSGTNVTLNLIQDGVLRKKEIRFTAPTTREISISLLRNGTSGTVYYKENSIKLEKGTKATDWTPAPEDVQAEINLVQTNLDSHTSLTNNPHSVTKAQVGLGNVLNVASYSKTESDNTFLKLSGGTLTGTLTSPKILINKAGNVASGISWYNSAYTAWQDYMANSGTTGNGVNANITAPSGTLVTAWARRSFIENSAGFGWTFESGTNSSTTPSIVAEIRASDGAAKFGGSVTAPTFIGALSGNASTATKLSSNRTFALTGDVTGTITSDLTSGVSIATTIAANSVALGTDTTGNYAASVGVSGNGLTITGAAGEGTAFTVNSNATNANTGSTLVFRDASGNFSAGTITASLSGNASTATKLQTARTLWGQSFDGTANVTGALSGATTIAASTSVTTPKVIFAAGGWSIEQSGTEIQFKYNGTIKQRMLSDGSIVAIGELTAYGSTS